MVPRARLAQGEDAFRAGRLTRPLENCMAGRLRVGRKSGDFASTAAENRRLAARENPRFYGLFRFEQTPKEFS